MGDLLDSGRYEGSQEVEENCMTPSTEWCRLSDSGMIPPPGDTVRKRYGRRTLGRAGMSIGHLGGSSCPSLLILSLQPYIGLSVSLALRTEGIDLQSGRSAGETNPRLRGPHSVTDLAVAEWGTPSPAIPDGNK